MIKEIFAWLDWLKAKTGLLKDRKLLFKEGEIWWCSVGRNVGAEIYGKGSAFARPVLIFKKFNEASFLGLPLTSRSEQGRWYFVFEHDKKISAVALSQARTFDKHRLQYKMWTLSEDLFSDISRAFHSAYCDTTKTTIPTTSDGGFCIHPAAEQGSVGNPNNASIVPL